VARGTGRHGGIRIGPIDPSTMHHAADVAGVTCGTWRASFSIRRAHFHGRAAHLSQGA